MKPRETASRTQIATRVEYWRKRRGLSRQLFADRMGKSVSWVDMVRRGDRQLDRLSVLDQIADVLEISVYALIDREQAKRSAECVDATEVRLLKQALQRYDGVADVFNSRDRRRHDEPNLPALTKQVKYAWMAFQASNYSALGPLLAQLISHTQYASSETTGEDRQRAGELLTQVYQITTSTLRKLGRHDLEWLAAERGIAAAEQTGNAVLIGGAVFRVVNSLGATDGAEAAVNAAVDSAHHLQSQLDVEQPGHGAVYGMIFLQGAIAAGLDHQRRQTKEFLDEAALVAARLGDDRNDYWTAFGPTNVEIYRVSAYVALSDWKAALDSAERIDQHQLSLLPRERRANNLVDVARACSLGARIDEAVAMLSHDLWRLSRHAPSVKLQLLVDHVGQPA